MRAGSPGFQCCLFRRRCDDQIVEADMGAEDLELESQSAASKQELIEAIIRKGGVPASALSKEELLRIARSTGSEVGTSMTKAELITAIDTSLVPVAGQQSEREAQCVYSIVRASGNVLWTPR